MGRRKPFVLCVACIVLAGCTTVRPGDQRTPDDRIDDEAAQHTILESIEAVDFRACYNVPPFDRQSLIDLFVSPDGVVVFASERSQVPTSPFGQCVIQRIGNLRTPVRTSERSHVLFFPPHAATESDSSAPPDVSAIARAVKETDLRLCTRRNQSLPLTVLVRDGQLHVSESYGEPIPTCVIRAVETQNRPPRSVTPYRLHVTVQLAPPD